jgi:TonB family protein
MFRKTMSLRERSVLHASLRIGCLIAFTAVLSPLCADDKKPPLAAAEPSALNDSLAPDSAEIATPSTELPKAAEPPGETGVSGTYDSRVGESGIGQSLIETSPTGTGALEHIQTALRAGEAASAKAELSAYIEQIEDATHRYSPELIPPLVLLGDAQMIEEDYAAAVDSFARAVHIDRVANGLHSSTQAAITYKEADALEAMGNLGAANDREMYAYEVQARQHQPDSMDILPATFRMADWHLKTSSILAARDMYERAVWILDQNEALQGESAIRALRGAAYTYRLERFPPMYATPERDTSEGGFNPGPSAQDPFHQRQEREILINNFPQGQKALQRVTSMVLGDPKSTASEKASALIEMGDWFLLFYKAERALPLYVEALELLNDAGLSTEAARLASPELLHFPTPPPLSLPPIDERESPETGHVTVSYTITEKGEVHDLATVETVPKKLMEFRVRRSMREARFRPPMHEGKLIASDRQSFTYEFQYYPKPISSEPLEAAPANTSRSRRAALSDERSKVKAGNREPSPSSTIGEPDAKKAESSEEKATTPATTNSASLDVTNKSSTGVKS